MSVFSRLAAWWRVESYQQREYREATERWRAYNAAKRAEGCPCGKPATVATYDHSNLGAVPVEFWTCAEHKGASSWFGRPGNMRVNYERPSPCAACTPGRCGGWGGPIGGPTTRWHCPDQPSTPPTRE